MSQKTLAPNPEQNQKPVEVKGFSLKYAAGLFLLSFVKGDLYIVLVKSEKKAMKMSLQDIGLPFGKEEEEDKELIARTVRREVAEETHVYPRMPINPAFILNRPHDRKIGEVFPNHFYYGWEDGDQVVNDTVIFTSRKTPDDEKKGGNETIEIIPKERVSEVWRINFLEALNPSLRVLQRKALIEFYYMLKDGTVKGHEADVKAFLEKRRFDLAITYESFERPTVTQANHGVDYFDKLVINPGCSHVFEPSSQYCLDFLTPTSKNSNTNKLVWFEYQGKLYDPNERMLLKV